MLSSLTEWVTDVIATLGYTGVALLVALENLFPPIPSEVVLPFAGFVASDGRASLPGMVAAATAGSMLGAWVLYGAAAAIGPVRLGRFVVRWGRWLGITAEDVRRAETWFDRRGPVTVLVGRCVPLIRSIVSIPAGFRRMAVVPFTIYTLLGSLVWNAALVGAGYALRDRWEQVEPYADYLQYAVVALIVAAVARFLWRRVISPRARSRRPRAGDPRSPAR